MPVFCFERYHNVERYNFKPTAQRLLIAEQGASTSGYIRSDTRYLCISSEPLHDRTGTGSLSESREIRGHDVILWSSQQGQQESTGLMTTVAAKDQ